MTPQSDANEIPALGTMRTPEEKEQTIDAIWKRRDDELAYWINEQLYGLESENFSIHVIDRGGGGFTTILFDSDNRSAVMLKTDTTAMSAESSHEYMMLEPEDLKKLAELFSAANDEPSHPGEGDQTNA